VLQEFKAGKIYRSPHGSYVRWLCLADTPVPGGRLTFYIHLEKGEPIRPNITDWRRNDTARVLTVWEEEE
jgi:hypothetical protein